MSAIDDFDVIVIGAGHNGLAATALLAAGGSSAHFASMQDATNGDFTHGLIRPEQMIAGRLLVPGSAHATPIPGLYLCGASCHPGPGVTFLPGYGAAFEVAQALAAARSSVSRVAA